jgi:8-oxo-dGTP diphosphatase
MEFRPLAADGVVVRDGAVALIERDHPPHEGAWVLPGGMVERDETARAACVREVREETGLVVDAVGFAGLFDDPGRDERGTVSAAYDCVPTGGTFRAREEARRARWWPLDDLPELGFDHAAILAARGRH